MLETFVCQVRQCNSNQSKRFPLPGFCKKFFGFFVYLICCIGCIRKCCLMRFIFEIQRSKCHGYRNALLSFSTHSGCHNIALFKQYREYLIHRNNIIIKSRFHTKSFCLFWLCFDRRIIDSAGILIELMPCFISQQSLYFCFSRMCHIADRMYAGFC